MPEEEQPVVRVRDLYKLKSDGTFSSDVMDSIYLKIKARLIEELVFEKRHGLDGRYVECLPLVDRGKT